MIKKKSSDKKLETKKIGFKSGLSIYKERFSQQTIITFKPKFHVTKNINFHAANKVANNLSKAFANLKPLKF